MKQIVLAAVLISCHQTGHADHPVNTSAAMTGPLLTASRNTLEQSRWNIGVHLTQVHFDAFSDTQLETFGSNDQEIDSMASMQSAVLNLAWGVTDATQLSISLPYIKLNDMKMSHNDLGVGVVHHHGDIAGTGDMAVLMQHNFEQFALQAGIKLKTGDTDLKDSEGNVLEANHQPGSAATDFMLGVVYSHPTATLDYDFNILYIHAGDGNDGHNRGNTIRWNAAASFSNNAAWSHSLELNAEYQRPQQDMGVENENSGGHVVFLSPGTRFIFADKKSLYISVGIPLVQSLHGIQHETSWRLISGMSVSF